MCNVDYIIFILAATEWVKGKPMDEVLTIKNT
jgi:NifU-like protein involved in Fe-S cluster formation